MLYGPDGVAQARDDVIALAEKLRARFGLGELPLADLDKLNRLPPPPAPPMPGEAVRPCRVEGAFCRAPSPGIAVAVAQVPQSVVDLLADRADRELLRVALGHQILPHSATTGSPERALSRIFSCARSGEALVVAGLLSSSRTSSRSIVAVLVRRSGWGSVSKGSGGIVLMSRVYADPRGAPLR